MSTTIALPAVGSTMPDIPLTSESGASAHLADVIAGSRSVIFFMRSASCAICLGHVQSLTSMAAAGALDGARVVVVVPGGAAEAARVATRVPAGTATVYASGDEHASVGLGKFLVLQHSGTFVVDANGSILSVRAAAVPTNSFSRDEVLSALAD